jgi:hypothetical protein
MLYGIISKMIWINLSETHVVIPDFTKGMRTLTGLDVNELCGTRRWQNRFSRQVGMEGQVANLF